MSEDEELEEYIDHLVERGLLIEHEDEGQVIYELHPDIRHEEPAIWDQHIKDLRRGIERMWTLGLVNITFSDEGPGKDIITLTDLAYDEEFLKTISREDRLYIKNIQTVFDLFDLD